MRWVMVVSGCQLAAIDTVNAQPRFRSDRPSCIRGLLVMKAGSS